MPSHPFRHYGRILAVVAVSILGTLMIPRLIPGCNPQPSSDERPTGPIHLRDEFSRLILGKLPREVVNAVGAPDRTANDIQSKFQYWHYRLRTRDPVTDKIDTDTQVIFWEGRVVNINY